MLIKISRVSMQIWSYKIFKGVENLKIKITLINKPLK